MKIGEQLICKKDYRYDISVNINVGDKCVIIDDNILKSTMNFFYKIKNINTEKTTIVHLSDMSNYFETVHEYRKSIIDSLL